MGEQEDVCCAWHLVHPFSVWHGRVKCLRVRKEGRWDEGHCLRRGCVAFFRRRTQLHWILWGQADSVEIRFGNSKADQLQKGVVLTRKRAG